MSEFRFVRQVENVESISMLKAVGEFWRVHEECISIDASSSLKLPHVSLLEDIRSRYDRHRCTIIEMNDSDIAKSSSLCNCEVTMQSSIDSWAACLNLCQRWFPCDDRSSGNGIEKYKGRCWIEVTVARRLVWQPPVSSGTLRTRLH
jgi:hypothetical protein